MGADWLTALRDVGGRLVQAALEFGDSRPPHPSKGGATGVRWLAEQLELHLEQAEHLVDDQRFIEGAGALLGLLLIEHLGGRTTERDGVHGVQVGPFGWFDPFEAVEEALAAEDPRRCLSERLAIAEREASGSGPVSRIVKLFTEVLESERPDLCVESQFGLTVDLNNGASVDLRRLERVAQAQDDRSTIEAARRIIGMIPGGSGPEATSWSGAASRIMPRLVSERFLRSLPSEQILHAEALGADVHLALQLRYEARSRYLGRAEVDAWAIPRGEPRQRAIENLVSHSRELRLEPISERVVRVCQGDGLDAARLLLPDLAARLTRLGRCCEWLAAAPHRDVLLLAEDEAVDQLAALASDAAGRAPHPISTALFEVRPEGPHPV